MPKKDMQDIWGLLRDLYDTLSPLLRFGLFGGLLGGLLLGGYLVNQLPPEEVRLGFVRGLYWFVLALTVLGGLIGLALAVAAELALKGMRGKDDKGDRQRKR